MTGNWKMIDQIRKDLKTDSLVDECHDCYDYSAISLDIKNVKVKDLVQEVTQ